MYSIGQVASFLGISKDQLRYYEKKKVFIPSQNKENSYREYNADDIDKILAIDFYRSLDLDFKTISVISQQTDLAELAGFLAAKQQTLDVQMAQLKTTQLNIRTIQDSIELIKQELNRFSLKDFPAQEILGRFSDFRAYEEFSLVHELAEDAPSLTQVKRLLTFDQTGIQQSEMIITKALSKESTSESLSLGQCVYTVVEDSVTNGDIMPDLFKATQRYMAQHDLVPVGTAVIGILLLAAENTQTKSYLEIYVPFQSD